jgi:zinc protease
MTTIVITGDITPQKALDITRREFGTWKASGPKPDINLPKRPDNKATNAHVPDSSSVQDTVVLAESIGNMDASNPERYFLQLGDEVLGDGFSSRLYRDLRVKNGYVYTVSSGLSFSRTRAGYSISFGADPDKVGAAARLALKNLEDMQSQFVTDSELNIAKSSILRSLPLQQASLDSIASHYLGLMSLGLPLNQSDIAAKIYYDATAENIRDAWKKYLRPADFATVIKGPAVK